MTKKITVLQAKTEIYYHSEPNELSKVTISPEREAIFNHLSLIGYDRFPQFVEDILVQVLGHKPVDITDGPGDEGQDILTEDPNGKRQLTQCKHTTKYSDHYSGDELDLLFSACIRKNCTEGLFVTNSDLTPQGKRYVTDQEYARGWNGPTKGLPHIAYWNSSKIWRHIATNNAILNKWFSGMGQVHGLRQFWFDLFIQELPDGKQFTEGCPKIIETLEKQGITVDELGKESTSQVKLNDNISFTMQNLYHSDLDLGVPYVGPETEYDLVNIPLHALRIRVSVSGGTGTYDPAKYRNSIVEFISDTALTPLQDPKWWYLVATTPQAFIYLQDIVEPKVISISHAESYVKVGDETSVEKDWAFLTGKDFDEVEEDALGWHHAPSGIDIALWLNQRPHPIDAYEQKIRNFQIAQKMSVYIFITIENASEKIIHLVHRIINPNKWMLMTINEKVLLLAHPPDMEPAEIKKVENVLVQHDIPIHHVNEEEREEILRSYHIEERTDFWAFVNSKKYLVTPIWLNKRLFRLAIKTAKINAPKKLDTWIKLLKYKADYETRHGFNFLGKKKETKLSLEETKGFLYNFLSIRGKRMLDVAFHQDTTCVYYRIRTDSLEPSARIIPKHIEEFQEIINDITRLCGAN